MPINVFGNSSSNSDNKIDTSLFVILIRRREIELISDGNKLIEIKVI